jgi:hypothetical protein
VETSLIPVASIGQPVLVRVHEGGDAMMKLSITTAGVAGLVALGAARVRGAA